MSTPPSTDMDWRDHIDSDPKVLGGKPRIKGTRISVDLVLRLTGAGWSREEILESYPHLTDEAIRAVYAYAADVVKAGAAPLIAHP